MRLQFGEAIIREKLGASQQCPPPTLQLLRKSPGRAPFFGETEISPEDGKLAGMPKVWEGLCCA